MKYVVLVSHGTFAPGLKSVLEMLAGGSREDVLSVGLEEGMSADEFAKNFKEMISSMTLEDEVILLGDIVGGSPLTNAVNELSNAGLLERTTVFGGMNLSMALTAVLAKDELEIADLKSQMMDEAKNSIKEFVIETDEEDDI